MTGIARGAGTAWPVALIVLMSCVAADAPRGRDHQPDAGLERLDVRATEAPYAELVRDFDVSGDTLYLLQRTSQITVLARSDGDWRLVREFGRAGGGPGEFLHPSGITLTPSGHILVIEAGRLQFLLPDGSAVATHRPELPCPMALPGVVADGSGIYIHGNCNRRGTVTDTMKAVVAWAADTVNYDMIAQEVRFTRDGRVGNVFGAFTALTPTPSGLLFGVGVRNCITVIAQDGPTPTVQERCPAALELYRAPPPPELEQRLRSGSVAGMRLEWPDALPVFFDRVAAGDAVVLLRPFTADSVVLQLAEPDGRDIAVAPLDAFVGCKAGGCLWVFDETEPARILLLTTEDLVRLAAAAPRRAP